MIIAIDNLDRCDDESVVSILGTVKTFMDVENCFYIISCDETAIIKHLQRQKGKYEGRDAIAFLNKVFQITLNIPPQIQEGLDAYAEKEMMSFRHRINFDPNVKDVLISGITKNPRKIRQILYNLAVLYKLAEIKENTNVIHKGTVSGNTGFLTKIIVLRDEWPDFYRKLENSPDLLDLVQRSLNGENLYGDELNLVNEILKDNPELDNFLKSTSLVKAVNVLPFIQLNQESFESTIPELESFIIKVSQNDYGFVRSLLEHLTPDKRNARISEIMKLTGQYIKNNRMQFAFNSLNVLLENFDLISQDLQTDAITLFSKFVKVKGIREHLRNFDVDKLFPLILKMENNSKENLLKEYCHIVYAFDNDTIRILKNFVDAANSISTNVRIEFDNQLEITGSQSQEKFVKCLEFLIKFKKAYPFLIGQQTIKKLITLIDVQSNNKTNLDLYLKLKHLASDANKLEFTKRAIHSLVSDNVLTGNAEQSLKLLKQLDKEDFPTLVSDYVFDSVKNKINQYTDPNHKGSLIELIFKIYSMLATDKQSEFTNQFLAPILSSIPINALTNLMNTAKNEKSQIFGNDSTLDTMLTRISQGQLNDAIIEAIFVCSPQINHEKICDSLVKLLKGKIKFSQVITSAYRNFHNLLERQLKDKFIRSLIESVKIRSWNEAYSIYDNISTTLNTCSATVSDEFSIILCDWVKSDDPNQSNYGVLLLQRIFNNLSSSQQKIVISEIFSRIQFLLNRNDEQLRSCFNFFKQVISELNEQELNKLIELVIDSLSKSHPAPIKRIGLDVIVDLKLDSRAEDIKKLLEELLNDPDPEVKRKSKDLLQNLD